MPDNTPRIPMSVVQFYVRETIENNPLDPNMSPSEQQKVKDRRRELIRQKHPDDNEARRFEQLLDVYEREDEATAIREAQIANADPMNTWTVVAREGRLGRFESIRQLGEGGTSQAWLCKTAYADITLVIKLVGARKTGGPIGSPSAVPREMQEDERHQVLALNEIQSRLGMFHPNVVRVYDVGHMQTPEGVFPYVAMEHVPGDTLLKWWDRKNSGAEANRVAAQILVTVADAIEFCHSKGIFHGDLTPANIMVDGPFLSPTAIKLIDFGLSSSNDGSASDGFTPGFGDPFLKADTAKDRIARDIYGLGATLYHCITGKVPPTEWHSVECHREWVRTVEFSDPILTAVVRKCLATDPQERYQTARQFQEDLSDWLTDHPLRHVRKDDYTWWERQKLLMTRSRKYDNPADHADIVAQAAIPCGLIAVLIGGFAHVYLVTHKMPPTEAGNLTNLVMLVTALAPVSWALYATRFRRHARKILLPLGAFVMACASISACITPSETFAVPSWSEQITGGYCAMVIVGIMAVCFGVNSREWRPLGYFGGITIASSFVVRYLTEPRYSDIAMPLILATFQGVACFLFAWRLFRRPNASENVN